MALKIAEQELRRSKVLLIDDDLDQHNLIGHALKNDFSLVCESMGSNALTIALHEKPDLILLDLQMPHIDGFEVLEQLKRHPVLASIPIFCLSATADEETRTRCYNNGSAGFFKKPVDIKTLSQDLIKTVKNLSNIIYSEDKNTSVLIGINEQEIRHRFHYIVAQENAKGKKVVTLSIREGVFFDNEQVTNLVNTNDLIFLQIKPSLITRLPFIDDLNIVMTDLKKLLDGPSIQYTLLIDRPEIMLLSPTNDNKTATILAFSEAMNKSFSSVHYLCKKPTTQFELPAITEMSRLLARQY